MKTEKIISSIPGKTAKLRAALRENANKQVGSDKDAMRQAAEAVLEALDEFEAKLPSSPIAQRVVNAFASLPASETDAMIIRALIENPGSTTEALSKICGWEGNSWHLHFGQMCERRAGDLGAPPKSKLRDEPFASGRLASFDDDARTFTMLEGAEAAFHAIGLGGRPKAS